MTRPAALLFCTLVGLCACQRDPEPIVEPPPPQPIPETAWAYVGSAPAWIAVDVAALREDPRAVALWDRAGATAEGDPLGGAMERADRLVIAWTDPAFSQRINVVTGPIEGDRIVEEALAPTLTAYTAGRTQVWRGAAAPWAASVPSDRVLVTGTPEAVRASVAAPCRDCDESPPATVTARFRVLDTHRMLAGHVLRSPALAEALSSVDQVDATVDLSLGLDLLIIVDLLPAQNAAGVALLLDELIDALAEAIDAEAGAAFAIGLLQRAHVEPVNDTVRISLELNRAEVDALAAVLGAPTLPRPELQPQPDPPELVDGSGASPTPPEGSGTPSTESP